MPSPQDFIRDAIGRTGLSVLAVADNPSFTYTIGLYDHFGYEILVVGLRPDYAHAILNDVHSSLKDGLVLVEGKIYAGDENPWTNLPIKFERADLTNPKLFGHYCVQAVVYWGTVIPVLQMVLCDKEGRMPEDPSFDHAYMDSRQPLLYKKVM